MVSLGSFSLPKQREEHEKITLHYSPSLSRDSKSLYRSREKNISLPLPKGLYSFYDKENKSVYKRNFLLYPQKIMKNFCSPTDLYYLCNEFVVLTYRMVKTIRHSSFE